MAATVKVYEKNGSGQVATDKTASSIRFKNADDAVVNLEDPLSKPSVGTEYSFEKWLRLAITGGSFSQISNLKVYSDGSNNFGTGIKMWWLTAGSYSQPVKPSVSNDPPQHASVEFINAFLYTSISPLDLNSINSGPFDNSSLPKDVGDYLIAVAEVEPTASQGVKSSEAIIFSWDEI